MKKILKIVLGIVWLLLTIFLLAGLLMPKVKYQVKTTVDMPLEQTFTTFNDISKIREWIPEVKRITPIEEVAGEIGSRYTIVMDNQGTEMKMNEKVLDYQPNRLVKLEFDADMMYKTDLYTFAEKDGQTTITQETVTTGKGYLNRCFFVFLKGAFKKIDQGYLDNFNEMIES